MVGFGGGLNHVQVSRRPACEGPRCELLLAARRARRRIVQPRTCPRRELRAGVAVAALLGASGAGAADLAATAWAPFETSGFYLGGHIGMASGGSAFTATQPGGRPGFTGTVDQFRPFDFFTGEGSNIGGFQFGYNAIYRSGLMLGLETDITFPGNMSGLATFATPAIGTATYDDKLLMSGSVRGRIGYVSNHWLYYATAGFAWTEDNLTRTQINGSPFGTPGGTIETKFPARNGWTAGAGVEMPLVPHWTARVEYLYSDYGISSVTFPLAGQRFDSNLTTQQWRVGLNYQLGEAAAKAGNGGVAPLEGDNWVIHGQTTFVSQFAPPFHAPYHGQNSLNSNSGRETWDATLYVGVSPWQGAEIWVNPEIDQGFGLSNTLGLAGFPSAEAYKLGENDPYLRVPRYFIRQTIDFGAATEKVDADINQFAGKQSPDRLVLTVGKFSASDIFDTVKYAHDPRNDFLNWTLVDAGTWDYSADAWGYTYGATAEWYHGPWAVRGGLFDLSIVPNSIELDRFHEFQINYEVERTPPDRRPTRQHHVRRLHHPRPDGRFRRRDRVRPGVRRHAGHGRTSAAIRAASASTSISSSRSCPMSARSAASAGRTAISSPTSSPTSTAPRRPACSLPASCGAGRTTPSALQASST